MNVIELKKLNKTFVDQPVPTPVLFDINLKVESGDFMAITGPSGSGKSTLMNILGLLDTPTSGDYILDGQSVATHNPKTQAVLRRQKIGFIFQSFNLVGRLTALQNVELPMIYAGISPTARRRRAMSLLKQLGIAELAKSKPNQISGGQAQRVAIARALANRPSLILADEPTGNLDSKNSLQIMDELKKLNQAGATIIIVTHNPEVADYCNKQVSVRDGRLTKGGKL